MSFLRISCTISLIIITFSITAQTVDERAKERAKTKSDQRVNTRIDQGLDKGLDAFEGLFKKKKKKKGAEENTSDSQETNDSSKASKSSENHSEPNPGAGMFGSMFEAAHWEDSYSFDFRSIAHITTTDKKGKVEETDMEWMISDEAFGMVMKDPKGKNPEGKIIFDYKNHSFITLSEDKGEKTGMAIAMNKDQLAAAIEEGVEEGTVNNGSFKKTGRTKSILGYRCEEYSFNDEETEGVMWMTTELHIEMNRAFGMMTSGSKKKAELPENYPQGYAMEMESRDTKRNESHHYIVTEVETSAGINIILTQYNVMDPMGMMNSGKK